MSNEQLLMEIGRLMGKAIHESEERVKVYVQDVVQASEERMKVYVHDVVCNEVQASEERMRGEMGRLSQEIQEVKDSVEDLRGTVQRGMEESEKMAVQIAATLERLEIVEATF